MSESLNLEPEPDDQTTYWIRQITSSLSGPNVQTAEADSPSRIDWSAMDQAVSMRVRCIHIPGFEDDIVPLQVDFDITRAEGDQPIELQAIQALHDQCTEELSSLVAKQRSAHPSHAAYPDIFAYNGAMDRISMEQRQLEARLATYRSLLAKVHESQRSGASSVTFNDASASDAYHAIIEGMGVLTYREQDGPSIHAALVDAVQFNETEATS